MPAAARPAWPDLVLSGHAHLYQRFSRKVGGKETPYIVCGAGGFAATPPIAKTPKAPVTIGDHTLEIDPIIEFGYLTIETDAKTLSLTFKTADAHGVVARDQVSVNLVTGKLSGPSGGTAAPGRRRKGKSSGGTASKSHGKSPAKAPAKPTRAQSGTKPRGGRPVTPARRGPGRRPSGTRR